MEQNGQNSNYPYTSYGHGETTLNNNPDNCTGPTMNDDPSLPLYNTAFTMGSSYNNTAAQNYNEVPFKFDEDVPGSTVLDNTPRNHPATNVSSQNGAIGSIRQFGARGMQAAHTVGPSRTTATHCRNRSHPYTPPQPSRSQAQLQALQVQRTLSRSTAAGDMAQQNATNAYTLPRNQLSAVQPQAPQDEVQGMASTIDQMATGSTSSSVLPIGSSNTNTQALGSDSVSVSSAPVRPKVVYHQLDSSRIDPAGPQIHPDPNWRAPGNTHWHDVLHNHSLLVYMSDSSIKDLLKHCDRLVSSGIPDPSNPSGPALIGDGEFTVADAQQVWNDCTAYTKRRQQLRNNSAASRSRNNKAAQMKHWKALALAAGASDRDFFFDKNDPGNAPGAPPELLAAVTQVAMVEMINTWTISTGTGSQASVAVVPSVLIPGQPPQPQIQQQSYGQLQNIAPMSSANISCPSHNSAPPTNNALQTAAAGMSTTGLPTNSTAPPLMAATSGSAAAAMTNPYQPNDPFEQNNMEMASMTELEQLEKLKTFNDQGTHTDEFDHDFDFDGASL